MGFEGFNPSTEEIKNISENKNSDSLNDLKKEINSQIDDKLLKTEASKELQEFIEKIKKNKEAILQDSRLVLNDLKQELQEDLNALNNLEDKFGNKTGFDTFKKFFISEVSDSDKEIVYDLVESGEFGKYIEKRLKGEMFPDIEELQDFIKRMKKRGKIEKKGEDSDIKEIFELKLEDLNLEELKYYDKKINDLLDIASNRNKIKLNKIKLELKNILDKKVTQLLTEEKAELTEEKAELTEEKAELIEEKAELTEGKAELIEEKAELTEEENKIENTNKILEKKKEAFGEFILSLEGKGFNLEKSIFKDARELLEKSKQGEKITGPLKKAILDKLKKGDNLKIVIEQAAKANKYDDVRDFLVSLAKSENDTGFLNKIKKVESELGILISEESEISETNSIESLSLVRQTEVREFFGDSKDLEQDGSIIKAGDKMVDLSEKPPKAYLLGEGGYKLETDMQKLKDTKDIIGKRRELQEIKLQLKDLKQQFTDKLNKLKEIEKTPEDKRTKEQKEEYDRLKREIIEIKDKIKNLVKQAEKLKEEFGKQKELFDKKEKKKIQEKQEKQKEVLEFLHKTGFDLIPQQFTDQLINEYKFNVFDIPGLKLNPERLDLASGMFGEEPNEAGVGKTQWKENLVKFLNKLIYGEINPKNSPLNPNAFIGVMGATINPTELQAIFEQQGIKSGSMWNINEMRKNLKEEKKSN